MIMEHKEVIFTMGAPKAIGTYSQAIKVGGMVFISGQLPLSAKTMVLVEGGIVEQVLQVFINLQAIAEAAGGTAADFVKLTVYLTDLMNFQIVNEVMIDVLKAPYPARATVGVSSLPKGALVEIDAILCVPQR